MLKLTFIVLIPLAVVGAAYYWRDALDESFPRLRGWRTVLLNAVPAGLIVITDLVSFLAGFGWDVILSAQTAAMMTLAFNVANIALRFTTTTPVGVKEPE
jgi:hypothetical protein